MDTNRYEAIEKRIEEGDVVVDYITGEKKYRAKVVGFNFSIGSTFVDLDNPNRYFLCTHGELSQTYKPSFKKEYLMIMDLLLLGIEKGLVDWTEIKNKVFGEIASIFLDFDKATKDTCSFN